MSDDNTPDAVGAEAVGLLEGRVNDNNGSVLVMATANAITDDLYQVC